MTTNWFRSLRSRLGIAMGRRRNGSRSGRLLCEASRSVVDALESRTMLTVSAVDDTIAARRLDVTLAIDVLANDSATNGAPLIDSFTQPEHGTVALLAGSGGARDRLAYTPGSGYAGTDAFTYTILDGDEIPETADVNLTLTAPPAPANPAMPRGTPAYTLSDGFVVGAFTAYTHQAQGNFSFTDNQCAIPDSAWTDANGIAHSVSGSALDTLVVTSTEAADGSWTYDESLTSLALLATVPVSGTQGLTHTLSGLYHHSFAATGGAAGSAYTFSASGDQSGSGTSVYVWNTSGGSSGDTSTPFTESGSMPTRIPSKRWPEQSMKAAVTTPHWMPTGAKRWPMGNGA
ncbi:MAG: Ig-like domain-containing protein [Tepidisphaerales bacterium]